MKILTAYEDERPIHGVESIAHPEEHGWAVGVDGVTKIVIYAEFGQQAYVPWLAIYKGDAIAVRLDAAGMVIRYAQ
jgi:hypothetical protein